MIENSHSQNVIDTHIFGVKRNDATGHNRIGRSHMTRSRPPKPDRKRQRTGSPLPRMAGEVGSRSEPGEGLPSFDTPSLAAPRRTPTQHRSRDRVERILAVATRLIGGKGSDQVRMSEIAALADISIGSLYQVLPGQERDHPRLGRAVSRWQPAMHRSVIDESSHPARTSRCIRQSLRPVLPMVSGRAGDAGHLVGHAGRQATDGA